MKALKRMLESLEVTYTLPVQPVYTEGINRQSSPSCSVLFVPLIAHASSSPAFPTGSVEFGNAGTGGPYSASGFLNPSSAA